MEYKKIDCNSFNIHSIKTDRFKTVHLEIMFRDEAVKEDLPKYTLLSDILTDCQCKYPTRKEMAIRREELYKLSYYGINSKVGSQTILSFVADFIDPKYIKDDNYLEKVIDFIFGCINKPLIKNCEFNNKIFNRAKKSLLVDIEAINECPERKSLINAIKTMAPDTLTSCRTLGTKEEVEEITNNDLYEAYQKLLNNFVCDIFIIGDVTDNYISIIKDKFKNRVIKDKKLNLIVKNNTRKKPLCVVETAKASQSNIVMIYNVNLKLTKENSLIFQVFNNILCNGGLMSILYQKVREENALCYSIKNLYMKYDGVLSIYLSTDKENVKKVTTIIEKSIKEIAKGKLVTEELLRIAKENIKMIIESSLDSNISILNSYIFKEIDNSPLFEEKLKMLKDITLQDIIDCAKLLKINTIYELRPGEINEGN